jgi:AcrR family transcriptional regulator
MSAHNLPTASRHTREKAMKNESEASTPGRKEAILRAATLTLIDKGYGDTRIAEVAELANVSTALLIYYFKTRERLLLEALKESEGTFYEEASTMLERSGAFEGRLETLVDLVTDSGEDSRVQRGLWLELWAQAQRFPDVAETRALQDRRWRDLITDVVRDGQRNGEVSAQLDARDFALTFATLLDGLSVQIAVGDSEVTPAVAKNLALAFARTWMEPPVRQHKERYP